MTRTSAILTARRDITPHLWIIRARPGTPIGYLPGQYVSVGLPDGQRVLERPYSLASAPHEDELEFFVELLGGASPAHGYLSRPPDSHSASCFFTASPSTRASVSNW